MAFKNVGTYNLDKAVSGSAGAANAGAFTMDAAGIASGQAFLTAELEKRDTLVRTPLTSFTYARDIPIRVGGRLGRVCFRDAGGLRHHWRLRG